MELNELIEAVKAAQTKAELEALVKAELDIELDKRKSLETLRGEVLKGLGVEEGGDSSGANGQFGTAGGSGEQEDDSGLSDSGKGDTSGQHSATEQAELHHLRDENAQLREDNAILLGELQAAQIKAQDLEVALQNAQSFGGDTLIPPALEEDEQPEAVVLPGVRLLRNTENGRDFAWTPELAKLPHMKEL